MKRLWMTVAFAASALGLMAQDQGRTLRPQQATGQAASAEARTALVIGNASYPSAPLKNPVQDAKAMAEALRKCGFQVTLLENATRTRMVQALRDFGQTIQGGGVGLLYYAGHGMQVKGKNYLVPVDADLASEDEVPYNTLDADAVLAKMESARNRLNILILDACRNNPFARSFRSSAQGLAQMDAPAGSYIAFATSPGRTAADGTGSHGLYTQHLLDQLARPGIKVEDVFKRVRASVMRDSQQQQVPWESSSITGDFYFVPSADITRLSGEDHSTVGAGALATIPAQDLLARVLKARGGLASLQALKSLSIRGKKFSEGTPGAFKDDRAAGGRFHLETEFPDGRAVMIADGSRIMMKIMSKDGAHILQAPSFMGDEDASMMRFSTSLLEDPMRLCAEGTGEAFVLPSVVEAGQQVLLLQIKLPSGAEYQYRIDPASFRPVSCQGRFPMKGTVVEATTRFKDFRKVGALWVPFQTEAFDPMRQTWNLSEEIEHLSLNPAFPKDHFRIPDGTAAPGSTQMVYPDEQGPAKVDQPPPVDSSAIATTDPEGVPASGRIRFAGKTWEVLEGTWKVEGDALIGTSSVSGGQSHLIMEMGVQMANYSVECDLECLSGWGWAGLLARASVLEGGASRFRGGTSDIQAYAFNFTIDKTFNVFRGVKGFWSLVNPSWTSWQPSPRLGGRKTHVRWLCTGKTLEIYAGQTLIHRFTDLELPRGSVAFALGEDATYRISNFKLRPLP